MVNHRRAKLLVRAAAGGHIDFTKADLLDPQWYIRRNLLLDAAEAEWATDFIKCKLNKHLAIIQSPHYDADVINKNLESANKTLDLLFDVLIAEDVTEQQKQLSVAAQARASWVRAWGDPNDPKVAQNIDEVVAALRAQRAAAKKSRKTT